MIGLITTSPCNKNHTLDDVPSELEKAAELCARARTLKPSQEVCEKLEELESEISQLTIENIEESVANGNGLEENGHDSTLDNTANNTVYSTPLVKVSIFIFPSTAQVYNQFDTIIY